MPAQQQAAPQTEEKPVSHPKRHAPVRSGDRRSADRRSQQTREQEGDQDAPVLAFGDHMPDFLKRPVKLPPLRKEEPEAA